MLDHIVGSPQIDLASPHDIFFGQILGRRQWLWRYPSRMHKILDPWMPQKQIVHSLFTGNIDRLTYHFRLTIGLLR